MKGHAGLIAVGMPNRGHAFAAAESSSAVLMLRNASASSSNPTSTTVEPRIPGVDLAPAAFEEGGEVRQHVPPDQREHRMRLGEGLRHRELRALAVERRGQPGHEIAGEERRIAGHGDDVVAARGRHPRVQAGERPGESADGIGHDRVTQRAIPVEVLVGVDQDVADLRGEPREHVRDHRPSPEVDQALVDAPHPPALAAGKHDAGDVVRGDQLALRKRSAPVNSR